MNSFFASVMLIVTGLIASHANAGIATLNPKCSSNLPGINTPTNGTGILFDEQCETAFVKPPELGIASLAALARNAGNLQFCPAVLKSGELATSLVDSAFRLKDKIEARQEAVDELEAEIQTAQASIDETKASLQANQETLTLKQDQLTRLQGELVLLKGEVESCSILGGDDCDLKAEQLLELKSDYLAQKQQFDQLRVEEIHLKAELARAEATKKRLLAPYEESITVLEDLQAKLLNIFTSIDSLRRNWVQLEGGTAQLIYRLAWADLVQKYKELNPIYGERGIDFMPISIKDARIFATQKLPGAQDMSTLPAVLSAVIPGASPYGLSHLNKGNETIEASDTDEAVASSRPAMDFLSGGLSSFSAQVILSLNGICQFFPEGMDSSDRNSIDANELSAHMVVNASLSYDTKVRRKYRARYNLKNMISQLEKKSQQKKWFFQTKDVHELIVDQNASDWFSIEFDEDSSDFSQNEQDKITQEVKADLINRALKRVAVITATAPALPEFSKTGYESATKLNKALDKLKCLKWYCQGFKYSLGVLDGFFGKKQAVSNFKQSNSVWVEDNVSQVKVIQASQIISFASEKESQPQP